MATRGAWKLRSRDDNATHNVSQNNAKKSAGSKSIGTSTKLIIGTLTKLIKSPFKKQKPQMSDKESYAESEDSEKNHVTGKNNESGQNELPPPLPPPPVLTLQTQDKNFLLIVDAINSLQVTMIDSHSSLERKLDTRLSSVEDQLHMLDEKFRDQDRAISDLRTNMVDTNSLKQVEDSLCKVASQADQKVCRFGPGN